MFLSHGIVAPNEPYNFNRFKRLSHLTESLKRIPYAVNHHYYELSEA